MNNFVIKSKILLFLFLTVTGFLSWQIYFKNSLILMPSEYKKIKTIVEKIAKENFLGKNDIRFSISAGSHAVFLSKELGICNHPLITDFPDLKISFNLFFLIRTKYQSEYI